MSLAHSATGAFLIVCLMGAAWTAPTTPSSGSQSNIEPDSQTNDELPEIKVTTENKSTESGVELTSEFPEDVKCRYAWQKFLVDFNVQYASYSESQKRRKIFCANWQRIQEHNVQYELGKVSHKKSINQWSDLTFEEWKNKQRPVLAPEFAKVKPTTNSTEVDQTRIKCQAAWEKFLTDFGSKYENVTETESEKRRTIFCENWQRIQEHNAQYELGKVTHMKAINEWSDLTFEEWKKLQESSFQPNTEEPGTYLPEPPTKSKPLRKDLPDKAPRSKEHPNMDLPGNKTNSTEVKGYSQGSNQYWFIPNMEEPGTYVLETPTNSNSPNMELPGNKTEASEVDPKKIQCQAAWEKFLTDFGLKYQNETGTETKKRHNIFCDNWQRIQEHNAQYELGKVTHMKAINQWSDLTFEEWKKLQESSFPPNMEEPGTYTTIPPNMDLPGNKTNSTEVKGYSQGSNQYWFIPNMEEPGTYVLETPTNSNPPNMELPGNKTEASEVDPKKIQCQVAWEKFLIDFGSKYENVTETEMEKRRSIFCDNWQRIQEHNAQYELGKVTHMKAINEWSDLTFEEWMKQQESLFPPNTEEPGTYIAEPQIKSKLLKEELTEEEPRPIDDLVEQHPATIPPNMDLPGNKTNSTEVKGDSPGSNQYWFSPNMEEPGTYLKPEELTHEVSRIKDKKEPPKIELSTERSFELSESAPSPNLKLSGNKTEEKDINSGFKEWLKRQKELNRFPPNLEEPGTYVEETSTKSKPLEEELADKVRGIEDKEEPSMMEASQESASLPNLKLSGNITELEEVNEPDMDGGFKEWLKRQKELNRFPPNLEEPGTYIAE